jgi:alpha-galactosidase/6-phospho-beta-glucosidase family protein
VLKRSKELAITSLAVDPNVGSFEMAESIFNEMIELQKNHLPKFK